MQKSGFILDIEKISNDAKQNLKKGALTENYNADHKAMIEYLNQFLATELLCSLRYKNHYYKAKSLGATIAANEFLEHAQQEQQHADKLSERIAQLGGIPEMNPAVLANNSHSDYKNCDTLAQMIRENLIAERIAVDVYRGLVQHVGNTDPTTRRVLEDILAMEEEHADDLLELADEYNVEL